MHKNNIAVKLLGVFQWYIKLLILISTVICVPSSSFVSMVTPQFF